MKILKQKSDKSRITKVLDLHQNGLMTEMLEWNPIVSQGLSVAKVFLMDSV